MQEVRKIYQIYIEYFFLMNFVFLYSIWNISAVVLSCSVTQKKLLEASFLGAVMICLFLFLPIILWYRLILGAVSTLYISVRFLFGKRNGNRGYIKATMVVFFVAVLLGGSIGIIQKFCKKSSFSIGEMTGITLFFSFGMRTILRKILLSRQKLIYPVTLIWDGVEYRMKGLLDTGNSLVEPISKKAVCIVGKSTLEQSRVKEGGRIEFQPQKFRAIPYHSVGKQNGILKGYEMDRLMIDTDERKVIIEKPVIGISEVPVGSLETYQMILQPELLREGVN